MSAAAVFTRTRPVVFASILLLFAATGHATAQLAPSHNWRTLETQHFHVHVRAGLEREGRAAAAAAERAYRQLSSELTPPRGTIDLVVADDADYSNGSASAFPSNRIIIYATPPIEVQSLRFNEDWLQLVITHELTHIFHLDRARGIWNIAQHVFGRGPDLFPTSYGPSWLTEGLAVYYESRFTQGGRLKDSEHRLLAQTSALEHQLPHLNQLSLASPRFPGGERAYAYGSLLVEYLAASRGDSTIRRFIDEQSGGLNPYRINHESMRAFGISFADAFNAWRDSVQASVGVSQLPVSGWRELTTHGYYATDPRWVNDSVLVYASNDGRSNTAQVELSLNGTRRSLGRRNSLGASIPLANGGWLFSQLEYTRPNEVRSDLFVERDGHQRQLTHGMRLVQPDAARDGRIVAVQLGAARSSLVLLDSAGTLQRVLRTAEPDETWSEPRWSPAGNAIAAAHRAHGGVYSLEVIDLATDSTRAIDRGRYLISMPSWAPDGRALVYASEEFGTPTLVRRSTEVGASPSNQRGATSVVVSASENIVTPELSPDGRNLAASTLRADGYHIGVAPAPTAIAPPGVYTVRAVTPATPVDSQPLAAGEYHKYSAFKSALPRYWYPVIEEAPGRGTRLGAKTTGYDVLGRHAYSAYLTVPTTGMYATAGVGYRYAGFQQPLIDVQAYQDYIFEATLPNGGTTQVVGSLLRRTRDASFATTFTRPRARTYSAFSLGVGAEHRSFLTDPGEFLKQLDPSLSRSYAYPRAFVSAQWSNTRRPSLSISSEDGIAVAATVRERYRTDSVSVTNSASIVSTASLFKSLDLPGFSHHVLALRVAAGAEDNHAATALEIGGTNGGTVQIAPGYTVGEGRRTFGVRGFPARSIIGTRALGGSLEYRVPALLGGSGIGAVPFFFDRSSITAFAEAATASCGTSTRYAVCSSSALIGKTIASVGAELVVSASYFDWDAPQTLRLGFAVPVAGRSLVRASVVSAYLASGLSF